MGLRRGEIRRRSRRRTHVGSTRSIDRRQRLDRCETCVPRTGRSAPTCRSPKSPSPENQPEDSLALPKDLVAVCDKQKRSCPALEGACSRTRRPRSCRCQLVRPRDCASDRAVRSALERLEDLDLKRLSAESRRSTPDTGSSGSADTILGIERRSEPLRVDLRVIRFEFWLAASTARNVAATRWTIASLSTWRRSHIPFEAVKKSGMGEVR